MEETFDPMLGYVKPHPYIPDVQVSSLGLVRIYDYARKEHVWTYGKFFEKRGRLIKLACYKSYRVCRLVAETFIPNPDGLSLVVHKDGNLDNNVVENLCWGTHKACHRNIRKSPSKKQFTGHLHNVSIMNNSGLRDIPVNTYPIDAGEVRCHPTMEHIGASSNGYIRVYNERTGKFRFTKGSMRGALGSILRYKGKTYKVCRLIAETFIPNPLKKPLVIHKDNDPSNNCLNNLFWGDFYEMQANSRVNKPVYKKLGVDPHDRMAVYSALKKVYYNKFPKLQFAGHVWHNVTRDEYNQLRPIKWYERPVPERYRK